MWVELKELLGLLLRPIDDVVSNGNSRYFWFYLLTSLGLTILMYRRSGNQTSIWKALFARDVWMSRSAINDYLFLVINPFVYVLLLAWIGTHAEFLGGQVVFYIRAAGVSGTQIGTNTLLVVLALTTSLFLVNDFFRFFMHYLMHRIPFMWEFHKVHHSAEVLNFATVDRFHPIDHMFAAFGVMTGTAIVNGVFIGFFGDELTVVTFAGANIFWATFSMVGGVLRHSPIWLSFGPHIERWIISPAMHHIHHSENPVISTRISAVRYRSGTVWPERSIFPTGRKSPASGSAKRPGNTAPSVRFFSCPSSRPGGCWSRPPMSWLKDGPSKAKPEAAAPDPVWPSFHIPAYMAS